MIYLEESHKACLMQMNSSEASKKSLQDEKLIEMALSILTRSNCVVLCAILFQSQHRSFFMIMSVAQ
jgi:hypothetical protein